MSNKQIYSKQLSVEHIGTIASFDDGDGVKRGEIRQIHHNGTHTYVYLIDPEYDINHNYAFPDFELDHDTLITLEQDNE